MKKERELARGPIGESSRVTCRSLIPSLYLSIYISFSHIHWKWNIFYNLPFLAISTSTHIEVDGLNRLWISDRGALSLSSQSYIFQATQVGRAFDGIVPLQWQNYCSVFYYENHVELRELI